MRLLLLLYIITASHRTASLAHYSDLQHECETTKVCLFGGCLTSQQRASVSEVRICTDNFTCCHTETEVANQTFYLTGSTSPSADHIMPGAWQSSHRSANFEVTGMTRPGTIPSQAGFEPRIFRSRGDALATTPGR